MNLHLLTLLLALAPDDFAVNGKAWVESISGVLDMLIAKIGVLSLAALAVYQNIKTRALQERLDEQKARLDRQGKRIDAVAIASVPTTNGAQKVEVVNDAEHRIPTSPTATDIVDSETQST